MQKRGETLWQADGSSVFRDGWIFWLPPAIPGQEYREDLHSLAAAAVAGGYTGVAVMPLHSPCPANQGRY